MLCISTSYFLAVFNLFSSFQTFFNDFTLEINKKRVKMNVFFYILLTPQSWSTCKSWTNLFSDVEVDDDVFAVAENDASSQVKTGTDHF